MARVLDWQSRGQGFESPKLHHHSRKAICATLCTSCRAFAFFYLRLFFASQKFFRSLRAAFCKQNCRLFSHFRSACYFACVLTHYIPFNAQYATLLGFLFAFGNLRATARSRYARQTPSLSGLTRFCAMRELRTQKSCHKIRYSVAPLLTNPLSSTITAARLFAQRSALLAERLLFFTCVCSSRRKNFSVHFAPLFASKTVACSLIFAPRAILHSCSRVTLLSTLKMQHC